MWIKNRLTALRNCLGNVCLLSSVERDPLKTCSPSSYQRKTDRHTKTQAENLSWQLDCLIHSAVPFGWFQLQRQSNISLPLHSLYQQQLPVDLDTECKVDKKQHTYCHPHGKIAKVHVFFFSGEAKNCYKWVFMVTMHKLFAKWLSHSKLKTKVLFHKINIYTFMNSSIFFFSCANCSHQYHHKS